MTLRNSKSGVRLLRCARSRLAIAEAPSTFALSVSPIYHQQTLGPRIRRRVALQIRHPNVVRFAENDSKSPNNNSHDINKIEQERKANLGAMVEEIKILVPNLLNKSLPKPVLSSNILLRICPTHFDEFNSFLPNLKGHVSYYATWKTIQLVLTSIVLSPKVKLHVQSVRVSHGTDVQAVYPDSTKIIVRWTTCSEGCDHLSPDQTKHADDLSNYHSTSDAKLGSHKWSKLDTLRFVKDYKDPSGISKALPSIATTISQISTALVGLTKEGNKLERVISGIFIFELNQDNDKIVVHTIEDVELVERSETEDVDSGLRVC